jgi:hypothetical protein
MVGGLRPIFGVFGSVLRVVGQVLEGFAPAIEAVASIFAVLQVPLIRQAQTLLPQLNMLLGVLSTALDIASSAVKAMVTAFDDNFYYPLALLATNLYNWFAVTINGMVGALNQFFAFLGFDDIKVDTLDPMAAPERLSEILGEAIEDNTEALRDFSRELTNLPAGFRYNLAEYRAENPDGRGTPIGPRSMAALDGLVINGPVYINARTAALAEEIKRNMRQRGFPVGGPSGASPPQRN